MEAKPISEVLPHLTLVQTGEMASRRPSTESWTAPDLASLPTRLNDEILGDLGRFCASPSPRTAPCGDEHFAKCLRLMRGALPRRNSDDLGGELFVAAYRRMLGHLPTEAVSFLAEKALETCEWFPTIAECLRIVERWSPAPTVLDQQKRLASSLIGRERQCRFDEAMAALAAREMDQAAIDALPEQWRRIASERCYLWWNADGSFAVRQEVLSEARVDQ